MDQAILSAVSNEKNLKQIAEGKTKLIFAVEGQSDVVLVRSKNRLTAFNAVRSNEIEGKGAIANATTCNIFNYLQTLGIKSHFVGAVNECDFVAAKCEMVPIEWVARRVATGSFLKRNPGVKEGYTFSSPKIETFFKDDANDDPQWSDEQIISAKFSYNGCTIGVREVQMMKKQTDVIFRLLEKAWHEQDCALIDMKIEFGVTPSGDIVLADVIDNDSWRVWPRGDKRLQLDKQFYRDLDKVTDEALTQLKGNYQKVADITKKFTTDPKTRVVIIMGSASDMSFADKIAAQAKKLGLIAVKRVCSAHKTTDDALRIVPEYESDYFPTVFVAIAGRSNGLGPVVASNTTLPVINAPPAGADWAAQDLWSSLRMPSGVGCSTVMGADEAGLAAAKLLSQHDHMVFGRILAQQLNNRIGILKADSVAEKESLQ
ncbi:hypothetical protein QR680_013956 [Steinernema hermaphroditum]|uniref:PurE domain-containing protein n=1 Tax=Steinernema hermaphroditum TaxID=289476 RepID=A0AA39I790_9BILA|nr:hypothetical protein QR680_013956 [Steinernema hermaphroditum]